MQYIRSAKKIQQKWNRFHFCCIFLCGRIKFHILRKNFNWSQDKKTGIEKPRKPHGFGAFEQF